MAATTRTPTRCALASLAFDAAHPGKRYPSAVRTEIEALEEFIAEIDNAERVADLERGVAEGRYALESGTDMTRDGAQPPRPQPLGGGPQGDPRREAMRTVDRCVNEGVMSTEAADRVDGVLQRDADQATNARWAPTAHPPAPAPGSG